MALKPLKVNFLKQNSYKQIAEYGNNLFTLENWKRLWCKECFSCSLNLNQSNFHWLNQWFALSLIYQRKKYFPLLNQLIFTDVISEKIFLLLNQLIYTDEISEFWQIYSNLFLSISISQIPLITSRFWLIQI